MIKIGDFEITRIEEVLLVEQPTTFADFRPELISGIRDWLLPNHYDETSNTFIISVHSWLVRQALRATPTIRRVARPSRSRSPIRHGTANTAKTPRLPRKRAPRCWPIAPSSAA